MVLSIFIGKAVPCFDEAIALRWRFSCTGSCGFPSCWRQWRDAQIGVAWSGIPRSDFTIVPIPPKRNPGLLDPWIRAHVWRYRIWSGNEIGANAAPVASRMLCLSPGSGRSFLHVEKGGVPVNKSLTINIRWWSNENHTIHRGGANW